MLPAWPLWVSFQLGAALKRDRFGSASGPHGPWPGRCSSCSSSGWLADGIALALNRVQPVRYGSNSRAHTGSQSPPGPPSKSVLHPKVFLSCRASSYISDCQMSSGDKLRVLTKESLWMQLGSSPSLKISLAVGTWIEVPFGAHCLQMLQQTTQVEIAKPKM